MPKRNEKLQMAIIQKTMYSYLETNSIIIKKKNKQTRSFVAESMPLHLVYELIFDPHPQSVLKSYQRDEIRCFYVASDEVRVQTEQLHADCAHGELHIFSNKVY